MKKTALFLAATAALLAAPATARPSPDQQLAKVLAGRVPGKPVDCINAWVHKDARVIDRTAIVYGHGRTVYLQVPDNPRALDDDSVLVTRLHGSNQLCSIDTVRLHDRSGLWYRGFVGLNKFIPYTRVQTARR